MKVKGLILVLLTALCWGPNFLYIKIAVAEIPPITLVFLRVALGTFALVLVSLYQKIYFWKWLHLWKSFAWMGITMNIVPFIFISKSELYISSALAGVLNSLAIVFIAIFSHFFGPHDPLSKKRIMGIFSSLLGLVIINLPMLMHQKLGHILGVFLMLLASVSYGVGTVYVKMHVHKIPSLAVITCQQTMSTAILFFMSLFIDQPYRLPMPSAEAIYSILALGAIGTGIAFIFYYRAIQLAGATYATLAVFFVAVIAMILGAVFLHEKITWTLYLGTFFILLGLLGVNPVFGKNAK